MLPNTKYMQNQSICNNHVLMNAEDERGSDSENFGARIAEIGVAVAKIWALEAFSSKIIFSGGFWGFSKSLGVVGGSWRKR
jgi:hypothetical protein